MIHKERGEGTMPEGQALINVDLKPAADVAIKLIDTLEKAVGWIASPKGTMPEAIDCYIEEIKRSNCSSLDKSALISNAKKTIKEYSRQHNIVQLALEQFDGSEKPEDLDEDWLSHFFDGARHVSNDDVQLIWGKILANECKKPGSVPKNLLHILSYLSVETAKDFNIVSKFVYFFDNLKDIPIPVINWYQGGYEYFKKQGLNLRSLQELDTSGLINFSGSDSFLQINKVPLQNEDKKFIISHKEHCYIGNVRFTDAGESLFNAIAREKPDNEYYENCITYWKALGNKVDCLD